MYTDLSLFISRFLYNIVTVLVSITMEISHLKTLSEFKVINLFCRIKIPTNYLQKIIKKNGKNSGTWNGDDNMYFAFSLNWFLL